MEIVPSGTIDPSPYMYDSSMYVMVGLQILALGANALLKPVPDTLHIKSSPNQTPEAQKN